MSSKVTLQKHRLVGAITILGASALLVGIALIAGRISSSDSISPNAPASQPQAANGCSNKCLGPAYYCYQGKYCYQSPGYCGQGRCDPKTKDCTYPGGAAKCVDKPKTTTTPPATVTPYCNENHDDDHCPYGCTKTTSGGTCKSAPTPPTSTPTPTEANGCTKCSDGTACNVCDTKQSTAEKGYICNCSGTIGNGHRSCTIDSDNSCKATSIGISENCEDNGGSCQNTGIADKPCYYTKTVQTGPGTKCVGFYFCCK